MDKELRSLLKAIEAEGFTTQRTRKGHWQVRNSEGKVVTVLSGTPSDHRTRLNELRGLKPYGFRWPRR